MNRAICRAHDSGCLKSASLMAGEEAFEDAVARARERPGLSLGIHLTFSDGKPVLPPEEIPDLVGPDGRFPKSPARAGLRYQRRRRRAREQVEREMAAQFDRLFAANVRPSHVDGHHHLHMHPLLFDAACRQAAARGVRFVRLPHESLRVVLALGLARGTAGYLAAWSAFRALKARNRRVAARHGLRFARRVYGLSRSGALDERYLLGIARGLEPGLTEVYSHPDEATEEGRRETDALCSREVIEGFRAARATLAGYGELSSACSSSA